MKNKICTICKISKHLTGFSKNSNGMKDGHLNQCKSCIKKRLQKWQLKNPLIVKERRKMSYDKNRDKNINDSIEWNRKNREKRKITTDKWRDKNKELTNHLSKNYHYRKKKAEGSHSLKEYKEKLLKFGGLCAYCGIEKANTKDHVIPLSKGGTYFIDNIIPACVSCNSSKGNKTVFEWNVYKNKNK